MTDARAAVHPGAILERKTPNGDAWDRIQVHGVQDFNGGATTEIVVSPVETFESPVHVDLIALDAAYEVAEDGEPDREWASDPMDVLLRRDSTLNDPAAASRLLKALEEVEEEPEREQPEDINDKEQDQ